MQRFQTITGELAKKGFSVSPEFLSAENVTSITREMSELFENGKFKPAGIGHHIQYKQDESVRRDLIHWLDASSRTPVQDQLTAPLEELRGVCNRELYLGLRAINGHYAIYPPGGFYRRHLDSFHDDDSRVLSVVIYLNEHWKPGEGGELLLHTKLGSVSVEPRGGTLVAFLSHEIEHEVFESHVTRKSFAGWFTQTKSG
jgi:SM-20-related protein